MIIMSIYIAIILCYVFLVCVTAFIYCEISNEKREAKRTNTNLQAELDNLQAELDKLKASCNNYKKLDSIYINEDKNMSNCKRTMVVNLLRKIINNLYDLSDNHLVEYNDIERTVNLAKTAESIIKN